MVRAASVLVLSLLVAGCGRERPARRAAPADRATVDDLVARVGEQVISAPDVAARMNAGGVGAAEALQALVDEALLVEHAHRLGLRAGAEAERAEERVMVRAMLRDLERANTPESITEEELRADFDAHQDAYALPSGEPLPLAEVENEIRTRLSLQKRATTLAELMEKLERDGLVELDDARVERILSKTGRLTRADSSD